MKKFCLMPSLLLLGLLLGGCSVFDGQYVRVTPHAVQSSQGQQESAGIRTYAELRAALTEMTAAGRESMVLLTQDYPEPLLEENMESAKLYACTFDPIGAYAVEDLTYEIGTKGGQTAVAVTISYRHSQSDIRGIVELESADELEASVLQAMEQIESRHVVLVHGYKATDFGQMVQKALAKLSPLDIKKICPLHGCVLEGDLSGYLALYDTWSSYRPETEGVAVVYASFYGNTRKAAEKICQIFKDKGVETQIVDLVHTDVSYALEAAFRYSRMIVAAPSYEGGLAPQMEAFLLDIGGKKYQSRKVGIIENGTFGPCAGKFMAKHLETMEGVEIVGPKVTIHSAMSKENEAQIEELAANILG